VPASRSTSDHRSPRTSDRQPPYLRELTAAPILLDNDANVIVLSERRGQRDRFDGMLLIKASTGLGAGIVAGGVLQRGALGVS
jgi:predicted NBD/HSP70 family sugar kinase